jgi:hypothetical protein
MGCDVLRCVCENTRPNGLGFRAVEEGCEADVNETHEDCGCRKDEGGGDGSQDEHADERPFAIGKRVQREPWEKSAGHVVVGDVGTK